MLVLWKMHFIFSKLACVPWTGSPVLDLLCAVTERYLVVNHQYRVNAKNVHNKTINFCQILTGTRIQNVLTSLSLTHVDANKNIASRIENTKLSRSNSVFWNNAISLCFILLSYYKIYLLKNYPKKLNSSLWTI